MCEFYYIQNNCYCCVNFGVKCIVVIGGGGVLGSVFVGLFICSGYNVDILEKDDWFQVESLFVQVSLVLVFVFINLMVDVIVSFKVLFENCILVDIISIKDKLLDVMMVVYSGLVVGLYFMFGLDVLGMIK